MLCARSCPIGISSRGKRVAPAPRRGRAAQVNKLDRFDTTMRCCTAASASRWAPFTRCLEPPEYEYSSAHRRLLHDKQLTEWMRR